MVMKFLAATLVNAATAWQYDPRCPRNATGYHSLYIPGCSGSGCGAPYETGPDCAFCVYDMAACKAAYDKYNASACQATYDARKAEGFCGCDSCGGGITSPMKDLYYNPLPNTCIGGSAGSPVFNGTYTINDAAVVCSNLGQSSGSSGDWQYDSRCPRNATGQHSLYIPNCSGWGCGKLGGETGPDCAFCVYDMDACADACGVGPDPCPCYEINDARKAEGYCGCNSCSSYGTCAGFWYDSSAPISGDTYMFYFYQDFVPVPNGQCTTGLKDNASLGSSSPAAMDPVAIQQAYQIKGGMSVPNGSNPEANNYSGAATQCMHAGPSCTGLSFTCSSAPNGCGKCTPSDPDCEDKFPPSGTMFQFSTGPTENLIPASDQAAYIKVPQIPAPPSPSPSKQSIMV